MAMGLQPQAQGGHGGIVQALNGQALDKPTNQTEVNFYNTVVGQQAAMANNIFQPLQPFAGLAPFLPDYYGFQGQPGNLAIRIGNISHGLQGAQLMDVKIGYRTASKNELEHSGMDCWDSFWKRRRMQMADWWTCSSDRGFRIIHYPGGPQDRTDTARQDPARATQLFFNTDNLRVNARNLITNLAQQSLNVNCFFIAASLLFCKDNQGALSMKLIDFGHSYHGAVGQVNILKYQQQFVAGLQSFRHVI